MSQESVALVQRAIEAFNRGDLDAAVDPYSPDAELQSDPRFIEGGTFRGHDEIRRWFRGLREGWKEGPWISIKEITEAGERVLVSFDWRATGEASGIEASFEATGVYTVRGGQIESTRFFFDRGEALEAAGVAE